MGTTDLLPGLQEFVLDEVLTEEPDRHRITLLGTLPASWTSSLPTDPSRLRAIIRLEKTAFPSEFSSEFFSSDEKIGIVRRTKLEESTDIYTWMAGWLSPLGTDRHGQGDIKINIICPATDTHIKKYSKQRTIIVRETPEIYRTVTLPYIDAFPAARTQWVSDILNGESEVDKVLINNTDYLILPDMKWDLHTVDSLYLVAISHDSTLRSLRDLTTSHIPLLKSIRRDAHSAAAKWGLGEGDLRMFIHYQPSYYHFHVHIVNVAYDAGMNMATGQAHLLDDVISLLEIDRESRPDSPGIFQRITLSYGLGEKHGLYNAMMKTVTQGHE